MIATWKWNTTLLKLWKSCYYQIRNIGQIRPHLTEDSCKTLLHALVTSRLNYGNALVYGLPQMALQRLQKVQNCAARLITRTRKYEHITPVHLRPTYKMLLNGLSPAELISYRPINRTLICFAASAFIRTGFTDCHTWWSPSRCLLSRSMEQFNTFSDDSEIITSV